MVSRERPTRDKATFDFAITVPAGLTVMANGVLLSSATTSGRTTWVWRETDPMAPYLATATLVHELSHMWFGDSVTLTTWPDIWLHEGFATWSEWISSSQPDKPTSW